MVFPGAAQSQAPLNVQGKGRSAEVEADPVAVSLRFWLRLHQRPWRPLASAESLPDAPGGAVALAHVVDGPL